MLPKRLFIVSENLVRRQKVIAMHTEHRRIRGGGRARALRVHITTKPCGEHWARERAGAGLGRTSSPSSASACPWQCLRFHPDHVSTPQLLGSPGAGMMIRLPIGAGPTPPVKPPPIEPASAPIPPMPPPIPPFEAAAFSSWAAFAVSRSENTCGTRRRHGRPHSNEPGILLLRGAYTD
jgi:hypothetical protein